MTLWYYQRPDFGGILTFSRAVVGRLSSPRSYVIKYPPRQKYGIWARSAHYNSRYPGRHLPGGGLSPPPTLRPDDFTLSQLGGQKLAPHFVTDPAIDPVTDLDPEIWPKNGTYKKVVMVIFHTLPVDRSGPYFTLLFNFIAEQYCEVWARSAHGKCVKSDQNHQFLEPKKGNFQQKPVSKVETKK